MRYEDITHSTQSTQSTQFRNSALYPIISFQELNNMFQQGSVVGYNIEPAMQAFSTPRNTAVTIKIQNGQNYLVIAQYDPITQMIYPPQ